MDCNTYRLEVSRNVMTSLPTNTEIRLFLAVAHIVEPFQFRAKGLIKEDEAALGNKLPFPKDAEEKE